MKAVTIHDLQDPSNEFVVKGLKRKCGACPAKVGEPCDTPTGVIHFVRATTHYWRKDAA